MATKQEHRLNIKILMQADGDGDAAQEKEQNPFNTKSSQGKPSNLASGAPLPRTPKSDLSQSYYRGQISCMKYSAEPMSREVQP